MLTRLTDQNGCSTHQPHPGATSSQVTSTRSCPDRTWSPLSPLLKRWEPQPAPCTTGSFPARRTPAPYSHLDEFTFRFNRRTSRSSEGLLFSTDCCSQAAGTDPPPPPSEITGGTGDVLGDATSQTTRASHCTVKRICRNVC